MQADFDYLTDKISRAPFSEKPFRHIYVENFFNADHFAEILASKEIKIPVAASDEELIAELEHRGYKSINFPGSVTDKQIYLDWHAGRSIDHTHHTACEGFGYVLRLYDEQTPVLKNINRFLSDSQFLGVIADRFGLDSEQMIYDGGIQKYLDGYEISPHPDIRKKAATYMININPDQSSESLNYHTRYLKFIDARSYVEKLWEGNPGLERTWVPWQWAETVFEQRANNSIVIFSPSNNTLHGVKAQYDHLKSQRTQLYGNLWLKHASTDTELDWESLDILARAHKRVERTDSGQGQRNI